MEEYIQHYSKKKKENSFLFSFYKIINYDKIIIGDTMNNKKGFTLVELVVAIAILGVITLIALPTIKSIQANNKKTKYIAYEKSLKTASKAYVDAFDEDLYGGTNYGCAIVKYSEMKEKDLISDLQIKGEKCDNDNDTFIYVLKDKKGNFGYFSNIVCRHGSKEVYSHRDDNRTSCKLETGDPPKIDVIFKPQKTTYYIGDHPKASIKISDEVGLKANQELDYVWVNVTTGKEITSKKTVKFDNIHFKQRITKDIDMPTEILEESMRDPTKYMLKVTGKVYDVNLNMTPANIEKPLNYFVGALLIKYKAGGAKMIDPHGKPYTVNASNDYVVRNGSDYNISKIRYKEEKDLWDYNNKDYINIRKEHYHMVDKEEWRWGTKVFSQQEKLTVKKFNYEDEDIRKTNKTVEVEANWKIDTFKLTYDDNGGKGCSDKGVTRDWNQKWDSNCTPKWDGHTFGGWEVDGKTLQPATISATSATKDLKAKAKWTQNVVTIIFNANKGSIESRGGKYTLDKSGIIKQNGTNTTRVIPYGKALSDTEFHDLPDNNSQTYIYLTLTGHHIDSDTAWSKNADGSGGSFDQTKSYPASDFCDAKESSCTRVLYANWRKNQYTLSYDDGGGYGCSSETLKKYHNEKWNPLCTPKRDGYTFNGWKDKDTGTPIDNNTVALKNTKAKAQWKEIPKPPKYTLTYDDNGGTGCSGKSITQTENLAWGTLCEPKWDGHTFNGWKDGSTPVYSTSKATKNVKVKADWTTNPYTITYMRNVDSSDKTSTTGTKAHGKTYSIANNPWNVSGKAFLGWANVANATDSYGTWYDPSDSYTTNGALTLYAQWYDIDSLEKAYTTYVQSGDFLQKQVSVSNVSGTAGSYIWVGISPPTVSGYTEKDVSGFYVSTHFRPYRIHKTGMSLRTLTGTSSGSASLFYLYLKNRPEKTYPTETVEQRIDRLQKITDTAVPISSIQEVTNCSIDNLLLGETGSYTLSCSAPKNYEYIATSGFLLSNGTVNGGNASRKYVNAYYANSSNTGALQATYSYANGSSILKLNGYYAAAPIRTARTSTYTSTKPYGKSRYIALKELANNGHANKYFPASYMKVQEVDASVISGTSWYDYSKESNTYSVPNGVILGTSRMMAINTPNGHYESYVVLADFYRIPLGIKNTAKFFSEFRAGNQKRSSSSGHEFNRVTSRLAIRYISSGNLS